MFQHVFLHKDLHTRSATSVLLPKASTNYPEWSIKMVNEIIPSGFASLNTHDTSCMLH